MAVELRSEFSCLREELEGSDYYSTWGIIHRDGEELKGYTIMTSPEIKKLKKLPISDSVPDYLRPYLWPELNQQPIYVGEFFKGIFVPSFPEFVSRVKSKITKPNVRDLYEPFLLEDTYPKKIKQLFGKHLDKLSTEEDMVKTREFLIRYLSPYKYAIICLADTPPSTKIDPQKLGMRERSELYGLNQLSFSGTRIVSLDKNSMVWNNLLTGLEFNDFSRLVIRMLNNTGDRTRVSYIENGQTLKISLVDRLKMYPGVVENKPLYTQTELDMIHKQIAEIKKTTRGTIEEWSESSYSQDSAETEKSDEE